MNSSVVCPACSCAPCSCSSVEIRPADAVVVECLAPQKSCCICYETKPDDAFVKYAFRCGCVEKLNYMCDDCVSGWLPHKKTCPCCRCDNFARFIKIFVSKYDTDFSFSFPYSPLVLDLSGGVSEYQQKNNFLKNLLREIGVKHSEFYEKVISKIQDEELTPLLQTFFNIYNFLTDNAFSEMSNVAEIEKYKRFFIVKEELNFNSITDINSIALFDFMEDGAFDPHDHTFYVIYNCYGDKWEQYRFNIHTEDYIRERIDDELSGEGIVYHNTYRLIDHLRSQELRNAFNAESPFWEMVRNETRDEELRAILDVASYGAHLWNSGEYQDIIFMNGDRGVFLENQSWSDYNDNFGCDIQTDDLIFALEWEDTHNLA
jgi:hypothetical protein